MNVGVNYLREHVADDVRMHYTYNEYRTDLRISCRRMHLRTTLSVLPSGRGRRTPRERVDNCARGAALMTGTRVEIERVICNKEMKVNRVLAETFYEEMCRIPAPSYTEEELKFAAEISEAAGFENGGVYFTGLEPLEDQPVPLAIGTDVYGCQPHSTYSDAQRCGHVQGNAAPTHWAATAQAGMSIGTERDALCGGVHGGRCIPGWYQSRNCWKKAWEEFR